MDNQKAIRKNGLALGFADNSVTVLIKRYLKRNSDGECVESVEEMIRRVAACVAGTEKMHKKSPKEIKALEQEFFDLIASRKFMPNSPTLMNAGREMGMLSACFVLPIGDSIEEIFDTVKATAMIQKAGGGTGFTFDRLRPTVVTLFPGPGRGSSFPDGFA